MWVFDRLTAVKAIFKLGVVRKLAKERNNPDTDFTEVLGFAITMAVTDPYEILPAQQVKLATMPIAISIPIPEDDVAVLGQGHSPGSKKKRALKLASKELDPLDEEGVDLIVGDSNVHSEEIQEPGPKAGSSIPILVQSLY